MDQSSELYPELEDWPGLQGLKEHFGACLSQWSKLEHMSEKERVLLEKLGAMSERLSRPYGFFDDKRRKPHFRRACAAAFMGPKELAGSGRLEYTELLEDIIIDKEILREEDVVCLMHRQGLWAQMCG